jgi:hypothetical protein
MGPLSRHRSWFQAWFQILAFLGGDFGGFLRFFEETSLRGLYALYAYLQIQ